MDIVGGVIVFIISWWVSFFCVLPIGVQRQDQTDIPKRSGVEVGAPAEPMIAKKALWAVYGASGITASIAILIRVLS